MDEKARLNKDNDVIDLRELFSYYLSNFLIICLVMVIGAVSMFLISNCVMQKKYQSTTAIYVLNRQENQAVTYSDLQTGTQLTKDYAELVKSRAVTTQVIAELNLQQYEDMKDISPNGLAGMIQVTTPQDTRIIRITITDTNPMRAQDIANVVREVASEHIYNVMDIEAVNVVDVANLPEAPVSPRTTRNIILGALIGLVLVLGVLTLIYMADDTIKTPDDVEQYLGLSVLAAIPYSASIDTGSQRKKKHGKSKKTNSKATQAKQVPPVKHTKASTAAHAGTATQKASERITQTDGAKGE